MLHVLIPSSPPSFPPSSHPFFLFHSFFLFPLLPLFSLLLNLNSFSPSFPLSLPPVISATLLLPTSTATHQVSLDITSCTADIVTPVGGANQSITTVALDPTTNIIYWAGSRESGVYHIHLEGKGLSQHINEPHTAQSTVLG